MILIYIVSLISATLVQELVCMLWLYLLSGVTQRNKQLDLVNISLFIPTLLLWCSFLLEAILGLIDLGTIESRRPAPSEKSPRR